MTKLTFAILLCGLLASQAATYYVRTDGNNANTGTANTAEGAWLTVGKAATTVAAGDTVNIQAGDYSGEGLVTIGGNNGSEGNYKRFVGVGVTTILPRLDLDTSYVWLQDAKIYSTAAMNPPSDPAGYGYGIRFSAGTGHDVITNVLVQCRGWAMLHHYPNSGSDYDVDDVRIDHCTITNCQAGIWVMGPGGGTGWKLYTNTITKLKEWQLADTDAFRCTGGGNHQFIGNLSYGHTTNDCPSVTVQGQANHPDSWQTWTEYSTTPPVTNIIFGRNIFLDLGAIQGTDIGTPVGHGGWTITNNVIGRCMPVWTSGGSPVWLPMGAGPINLAPMSYAGARLPIIVKNNTFLLTSRPCILEDSTSLAVYYTNNIFMTNGSASQGWSYKFNSSTGSGDYNCAYFTAAPVPGANDINQDPLFVDITDPLGTGLNLQAGSPCISGGVGGSYIGAYAYGESPPASPPSQVGRLTVKTIRWR